MSDRSFPVLDALIGELEETAADQPGPFAVLLAALRLALASDVDPYLLTGTLIEGVATTIARNVPADQRGDMAIEAVRLMRDRLHTHGLI